jgi:hypothetical protein
MRRGLYWSGVLVGVLLLAGGVVVGARALTAARGASGVVRDYFAALVDGDAPRALAYGTVPDGPHTLLSAAVLREQQRIAPMRHVTVTERGRRGGHATVRVTYLLAFPHRDVPVSTDVGVHRSPSGDWRLDAVAVRVELLPGTARQRESMLGGRLPTGSVLLFPGALPIRLDTPYLRLDGGRDNVTFGSLSSAAVGVQVSDAGRTAMLRAVRDALRRCVTGPADPACPLPSERYVPGSVSGRLAGPLRATEVVLEAGDPVGTLRFTGSARVAGRWQRLTFANRRLTGSGTVDLDLRAVAYAVAPLRVRWLAG